MEISRNVKLSVRQFSLLVMFFTIGTTILIIPGGLALVAKQDAWIAAVVGVMLGVLPVLLYNSIGKLLPDLTLIECNEKLFGKWIGTLFSILFIFFAFIGSATLLFYVGNFMTTQVMPRTPIQYINILFISIVVMGVRLGLETIARAAEVFFPWFLVLFLVLVIFLVPEIEIKNIQPVFDTGVKPIMQAALSLVGTASLTLIVFLMIVPACVNNPNEARKDFIAAVLLGGLFIIIITLLSILILGSDTTARQLYPSYVLAKKINVGNFVERIESIMAGLWFFTIYFKMTLYFYAAVVGLAQVLKLRDYRPLCFPMGMLVAVYSLVVYPNVVYMMEWDSTVFIPYVISIGFIFPLIILVTAWVRKKRGSLS